MHPLDETNLPITTIISNIERDVFTEQLNRWRLEGKEDQCSEEWEVSRPLRTRRRQGDGSEDRPDGKTCSSDEARRGSGLKRRE
ncbi:hypothetical protein E2C01_066866 [Portunus trituberculatus]|uniref:Uncharacterized protein n=1 Tax=Portunus trituberculatus TaxID=210409 RepID=A0A5B7HVW0_PORTR|nr:hypothetical protein [Portunus trituberculatus]